MNKSSYASSLTTGVVLILFLQPWLVIGGLLYNYWAHYGLSVLILLLAVVWLGVFFGSLWAVFVKLRQALSLANAVSRKIPIVLAVLAGLLVAGVVCCPLVLNPVGARWVPAKEPTEDRRIVHPLGFSIVSPPGWKAKMRNIDWDAAAIMLGPGYKGRHGPGLAAHTLASPPDLSQFRPVAFSNFKAFELTVTGRGDNARLRYELVLTHKDRWYRVVYSESRAFESNPSLEFPEIMKRYVWSFRPPP
jgi:hypothetical protein